jgi:hypothetical protein
MKKELALRVTMLAVERRVLPLKDETAVEHAKRLFAIAEECMAACLPEGAAEPTPAEPAAEAAPIELKKMSELWVWKKPSRSPYVDTIKVSKRFWD